MNKLWHLAVCAMLTTQICVAQDLNIVLGTIVRVDSTTKTIVVKTANGTEHTIRATDAVTVKGTKDGFNGLREGSQIVARTTGAGTDEKLPWKLARLARTASRLRMAPLKNSRKTPRKS